VELKKLTLDRVNGSDVVNTGNGSSGSMKGCEFIDFPKEYEVCQDGLFLVDTDEKYLVNFLIGLLILLV
jgi:hypothetical protein